jgi:hypothetical protein
MLAIQLAMDAISPKPSDPYGLYYIAPNGIEYVIYNWLSHDQAVAHLEELEDPQGGYFVIKNLVSGMELERMPATPVQAAMSG